MRSTFNTMELARRALLAHQQALDVTGRNVANAQTRGYSRLAPAYATPPPYNVPLGRGSGQVGTGVSVAELVRFRDEFLDLQFRQRAADQQGAETWVRTLDQVEQIWGEPGDAGLQMFLNRFWEALDGLANRPGESGSRVQVLEAAKALVGRVQDVDRQLRQLQANLDNTLTSRVYEVNQIATEIAGLNQKILESTGSQQPPFDLQDQRDLLLDRLAGLAGATWVHQPNGMTNVYINSIALVSGNRAGRIDVEYPPAAEFAIYKWAGNDMAVEFRTGEMGALQEARDVTIPERYIGYLETFMGHLSFEFNQQHAQGYAEAELLGGPPPPGPDFFTVIYRPPFDPLNPDPLLVPRAELSSLAVELTAAGVRAHELPAAAALDGGNARKLANLLTDKSLIHPLTGSQPVSLMNFYQAVVGDLGILSQSHRTAEDTFGLQLAQADALRQGVSGVNLDEELTRLIEFQKAYTAAARIATSVDELLDVILNRLGVVGR